MAGEVLKLAVLIDGDNISPDLMGHMFRAVAPLGRASIRIVYGAQADKQKWLAAASRFALSQGRRHLHATGRNATDIEMVIGAMDLLARDDIDGFCLVTADSDFTSLAIRIRESGKLAFGFGDAKSPASLRNACDHFFLIEVPKQAEAPVVSPQPIPSPSPTPYDQAIARLREAFSACASDQWASLSDAGKFLRERYPDFSPKQYQAAGIKKLVEACGTFELARSDGHDFFRPHDLPKPLKLVKT